MGFPLGSLSLNSNIISEKYTSYALTPEELSAKGHSKSRPLYNYVSASDDIKFINTPADTYKPDKISNNVTVDNLQQKRLDEIGQLSSAGQNVL
jgi:hypothetical protein